MTKRIKYEDGAQTGCPFLSWFTYPEYPDCRPAGTWIAKKRLPPCREKVCWQEHCHNYGGRFDQPDRVLIDTGEAREQEEGENATPPAEGGEKGGPAMSPLTGG